MTGPKPPRQIRMSDTATAACDDFFSRKYRSFANGRLPRADDEVKALVDYFSIEISQISYRLRKWRNQSKVPGELLDLGDKFRDGVGADLEERVGDGLDLVEIAVDEMLLRESALKEDPDLESIRATIAGSDEVKTFLCAVIAAWCSLVLMCTAKNVNSTGVLELELIKARRASREKNASEFADIMGGLLATGFPTSKIRLFFWLLERRLWDCFSTALRADEHPVLIVPTSQPLFPAADLGWQEDFPEVRRGAKCLVGFRSCSWGKMGSRNGTARLQYPAAAPSSNPALGKPTDKSWHRAAAAPDCRTIVESRAGQTD